MKFNNQNKRKLNLKLQMIVQIINLGFLKEIQLIRVNYYKILQLKKTLLKKN